MASDATFVSEGATISTCVDRAALVSLGERYFVLLWVTNSKVPTCETIACNRCTLYWCILERAAIVNGR